MSKQKAIEHIINSAPTTRSELDTVRRTVARSFGVGILQNSDILEGYRKLIKSKKILPDEILEGILRKRSVRTQSGIAPVAVLTAPYPCPGNCVYCPNIPNVPVSYLPNEPAVMRAIRCDFDPYLQVQYRLRALIANGHEPTKIELIVIGGTWSYLPIEYKYEYILRCFQAANDYKKTSNKKQVTNKSQNSNITKFPSLEGCPEGGVGNPSLSDSKIRNSKFEIENYNVTIQELKKSLLREQSKNEKSKYNIIGITLETRPDYIDDAELLQMRELGCTRVEMGVQALDDDILKLNKRGHGVAEVARATALLRDYGFKVTYHIMPALPGSTPAKDLRIFKMLFTDERFQPDQLKFYPTVVTKGSLLYKWWKAGKYKPYTDKQLQDLIVKCKALVPRYVRIIRLIRDIPNESIEAGNRITNLRQIMKDRGVKCNCIRCRESKGKFPSLEGCSGRNRSGVGKVAIAQLRVTRYDASGGTEYFIEATDETEKILYGFCRLRLSHNTSLSLRADAKQSQITNKSQNSKSIKFPSLEGCPKGGVGNPSRSDSKIGNWKLEIGNYSSNDDQYDKSGFELAVNPATAMVRELHVYGELVSIGSKKQKTQHTGLGKILMAEAERIARKAGFQKIAVISGVGVRGYYRKLGYRLQKTYMTKKLKKFPS